MSNENENAGVCKTAAAGGADTAELAAAPDSHILTLAVVARMFKISPLALRLYEQRGLIGASAPAMPGSSAGPIANALRCW